MTATDPTTKRRRDGMFITPPPIGWSDKGDCSPLDGRRNVCIETRLSMRAAKAASFTARFRSRAQELDGVQARKDLSYVEAQKRSYPCRASGLVL